MKTSLNAFLLLFSLLISLTLLFSCDIEQDMRLNGDLSGTVTISGAARTFAGQAFEDLSFMGGFDSASSLYEDALINSRAEMAKRDDISAFDVEMTSTHEWKSTTEFSDLRRLLGSPEAASMVSYRSDGGISTLTLLFDRDTSEQFGELIPLFENPAFAMFDPSANKNMDEESYIQNILGFSFGPENIPEIRGATVRLNLTLPGRVTSVEGGERSSSNSVIFEMPLSRMLVPMPPVEWSVSWQ